jgi:hypothetical protein
MVKTTAARLAKALIDSDGDPDRVILAEAWDRRMFVEITGVAIGEAEWEAFCRWGHRQPSGNVMRSALHQFRDRR